MIGIKLTTPIANAMKNIMLFTMMLLSGDAWALKYCKMENTTLVVETCPTGTISEKTIHLTKPATQSEAAQAAGTTDYWINQGYPGGLEQYKEVKREREIATNKAARHAELVNRANSAPNGNMSPVEYGNSLRAQKAAQRELGLRDSGDDINDSLQGINRQLMLNNMNQQMNKAWGK